MSGSLVLKTKLSSEEEVSITIHPIKPSIVGLPQNENYSFQVACLVRGDIDRENADLLREEIIEEVANALLAVNEYARIRSTPSQVSVTTTMQQIILSCDLSGR